MAKYKNGNYCQIYNKAIKKLNEHNRSVPYSTRWLYTHLHFLEHRLTGEEKDYFYHNIKEISRETGISYRLVSKGIKILKELNLIHTWQAHRIDKKTGKKSEEHITHFRILEQ